MQFSTTGWIGQQMGGASEEICVDLGYRKASLLHQAYAFYFASLASKPKHHSLGTIINSFHL